MASFNIASYTDTTVTIAVIGLTRGDLMEIVVRPEPETGVLTVHVTPTATAAAMPFIFSGLSPNTKYAVNVRTVAAGGALHGAPWIGVQYFTTKSSTNVEDWDWTISNGSATAAQTQLAYTTFVSFGANVLDYSAFKRISYLVWNDIVNKTLEVITDRDGTWNTDYGTLAETRMTATDKEMTARRFNAIVWNLAQYKTPLVTRKAKGNDILGEYFTLLTDSINNTIYRG